MIKRLLSVNKPLRYTGGEQGVIIKDPVGKLNFCLTFPDVYEIGMSNLGFKILYSRLNQSQNISCERFFAPWPDALEILGDDVMVSLENKQPLINFDVLGFSMQYELSYTTAVQILKKAHIPVESVDRHDNYPIIIAGGGCILNPAPLSSFIDAFFLGEMDVALADVMEELHVMNLKGASRIEKLQMLNKYPFIYVPMIDREKIAVREVYKDFGRDNFKITSIIPIMPAVQDRLAIEIARGCTNGCRFCQAGIIYRPVREVGVSNLCTSTIDQVMDTGYRDVSLLSLDSGDYNQLTDLLTNLGESLNKRNVSLSMPSLRAETVSKELFDKISTVRKSGFTIAPEAGTQRLRDIINKNLTEQDIVNAAVYAKDADYNGVKLYFMCGLPYETDDDILGIARLVSNIKRAVRGGRGFNITVSLSNFVPKPHTPFERFPQINVSEMIRRQQLLKEALIPLKVKFKYNSCFTSSLEAAFARGDERIGDVIKNAVNAGAYLDAWDEFFSKDRWKDVFNLSNVSIEDFACKSFDDSDRLPWGMVDCGVSKQWLLAERDKAVNLLTTPDCRSDSCSNCGVCIKGVKNINSTKEVVDNFFYDNPELESRMYKNCEIIFEKRGIASLMSALEISRVFAHMALSSGLTIKYTSGFNPQPRIVVAFPTSVGVEGLNEYLFIDIEISDISEEELMNRLNIVAPEGLKIKSVTFNDKAPSLDNFEADMELDELSFNYLISLLKSSGVRYEKNDKKGKLKIIDISNFLVNINTDLKRLTLKSSLTGSFNLSEFFRKSDYDLIPDITRVAIRFF